MTAVPDHDHVFGQDRPRPGERRTLIVIAITAAMMVVEIVTGLLFGSMALLADGLHMGSHAAALSINAFAYVYARRHAHDARFSFGTGKVNALGGFAGAVLLAVFALLMAGESVHRLAQPVPIAFNQAILVAVIGLLVNSTCVLILDVKHDHHDPATHDDHHHHHHHHHRHDHNLRSAYLHVLADALTSLLAIAALVTGKYLDWVFMDPLMGIVGAILVARWSLGLLRDTSQVLLDHQAPAEVVEPLRAAIESDRHSTVTDIHVWSIGPGIYAASLMVRSSRQVPAAVYRQRVPAQLGIVHLHIETTTADTAT